MQARNIPSWDCVQSSWRFGTSSSPYNDFFLIHLESTSRLSVIVAALYASTPDTHELWQANCTVSGLAVRNLKRRPRMIETILARLLGNTKASGDGLVASGKEGCD